MALSALHSPPRGTSNGGDELIAELDATSPASIRELLRRGALVAAERSDDTPLRVGERDLLEALAELRSGGANELTRTLLGGAD